MNIKHFSLFLFLVLFCLQVNCQEYHETETHIFWKNGRSLSYKDFQGDGSYYGRSKYLCDSLNMCYMAFVGVYTVLDIPKKEKDRGRFLEKPYFVPMFDKTTSYIIGENDSIGIQKQQIIFDIYELSARYARKELDRYKKEMGSAYGTISIMFSTVADNLEKFRQALVDEYTKDVYIQQRNNAYSEWRLLVDDKLEESKEYATTTEDYHRAYIKEPIDKKYIFPDTIIGNLFDK